VPNLDYALILELIPFAVLLYNRSDDVLLAANGKFGELSGYLPEMLSGLSLGKLLSKKLDTNPTGEEARAIQLKSASGDILPVNLKIKSLSQTNQIVALIFSTDQPSKEYETKESIFESIAPLIAISQQLSSLDALSKAAEILDQHLHPQALAVYLFDSKNMQLSRIDLKVDLQGSQFPAKLELNDLSDTASLSIWRTEQKPTNALQEIALVQGHQYLLILPLNYQEELQGCFVVSGFSELTEDDIAYFNLLGKLTANTIHALLLVENAQRKLESVRQLVQIEHVITDNLEEGIILLTPDLRIAEISPSAEDMLGYATSEAFRQKADLILIGSEPLSAMFQSAQQGISTQIGNNFRLNTRTGDSFMAEIQAIPVMVGGQVVSIILILRDMSQSEQIRAKNQELEQRAWLGELSAVFAHEVKNPINSIMTGLQYMGMTMKPDDPHHELVNRLQNDCLRLTHLMDSTLVFSKPVEYHLTPVDLSNMLPSILEKVAPRMTNLNIKYNFDANPSHPMVKADYRALERVFENLINNAIQAMEKTGGTLSIKINQADAHLVPLQYDVIVADSGPGIPDDLKEHIFEPFVTTKSTGTGLGLAISKRIMTAHKGNITVESFPGGTMFHVLIPKAD